MKPTKEEILEQFAKTELTKVLIRSRNFTYDEVLKAMDEYAKIDWISVKDRLPEKIAYYLILTIKNKLGIAYWDCKKWWDDPDQDGCVKFGIKDTWITHWMSLPEKPED